MKYFSIFSGIGGFDLPLNNNGHECVGYSEIDKYAIQIYKKNFGEKVINYGDATKINSKELPNFDLLVGGFPCQAFSLAGKRQGFNDTRGTLFFEIARILKDKKPRHFLLENVKGLLSHENGRTFKIIISTLNELGYDVQWLVFNSKQYGTPQNRERVLFIGHFREECGRKIFPFGFKNKRFNEKNSINNIFCVAERGRYGDDGKIIQCLEPRFDGVSNTLTSVEKDNKLFLNGRLRRFTPIECERLQGFPDNWTEGISDSQRFKCLGNAVTTKIIDKIIKEVFL